MIGFCDLNYVAKAIFLTITFIALCFSLCLLPRVFRRKTLLLEMLVPSCLLVSGGMLILFAAETKFDHPSWQPSPFVERITTLPILLPILLLLAVYTAILVIAIREGQYERNAITRSSVKESLDSLNTGLCFAYKNGMVMLKNHQMNHLSYTIFGRELKNANVFWEELNDGAIRPEVTRLSMGENPSFRLSDQTVWTFAHKVVDGITQITAAETTRLNLLTEELKKKNEELADMNRRLQICNENIEALTREKERLETKARIHRELGKALLMARGYLQREDSDSTELLSALKYIIAMLRLEAETPQDEDPLAVLTKAAHSAGIEIHVTGQLPMQEDAKQLFFEAATEALTNAARHADAKDLYIVFSEDDDTYGACFTNGGEQPQGEIVEGGGLGSLRKKTEQIGGTMDLLYQNGFVLKLTVLKKGGGSL